MTRMVINERTLSPTFIDDEGSGKLFEKERTTDTYEIRDALWYATDGRLVTRVDVVWSDLDPIPSLECYHRKHWTEAVRVEIDRETYDDLLEAFAESMGGF